MSGATGPKAGAELQKRLESSVKELQDLQKEFSKMVTTRTQLESQLQENEMVLTEFNNLTEDSNVFKLVGPVLVKQDQKEAHLNVRDRIELIKSEIKRAEQSIKDIEAKQDSKRKTVIQHQQEFQQWQAANGPAKQPQQAA